MGATRGEDLDAEAARLRRRVAELAALPDDQFSAFVEALLSAIPGVVLRFDPDLRIRFASRLVAGLFEEQVIGAPALDFIPREDRERAQAVVNSVLSTGKPGGYETVGPGPDGEPRTYEVAVAPIRESDGRMGGCFVAIDSSRLRERERALAQSEQKLRIALAATKLGLWSWDLASGELIWDERMQQALGRSEPLSLPDYVATVVHPDDRSQVERSGERAMATGRFEPAVHRIVRPDGEVRWMLTVGEIERDASGTPVRLMGGNLDITEQRELEEQLLLARKMEAVGRLTAGVAHNFNNMLMVVLPSLELLHTVVPDSHRAVIDDAVGAAEHAADMVRKLMTFAGQRRSDAHQTCEVSALVERIVGMCSRTFDRHIVLHCDIQVAPAHVKAAAGDIEQVLMNLLLNARDALLEAVPASPRIDVTVSGSAHDPNVTLRVHDNGTGMSESVRQHAFEPFFTSKEVGRGTGLGLATCYALVRDLDGQIEIDSELGLGTTVSVTLPRATVPNQIAAAVHVEKGPEAQARVLLIDDEPALVRLLERALSERGCQVMTAIDGADALARLPADGVDVILLDRSMPNPLGSSLLTSLRERAPGAKIAYFTGQEVTAEERSKVDAVLQKPIRIADLEDAVAMLARGRPVEER